MKKTKSILIPTVFLLILTIIISIIPTECEAAIYDDTIRLHILANSDSESDQTLKIKLRDKILRKYSLYLSCSDIFDAEKKIEELLPEIEEFANQSVRELGYDYKCRAKFEEEWFDRREYADFTLPSGSYKSLIIEIGEGSGQNWWCVMFPPMCLDIATESLPPSDGYTKEELNLIGNGKYSVKFKLLELISSVTGKQTKKTAN